MMLRLCCLWLALATIHGEVKLVGEDIQNMRIELEDEDLHEHIGITGINTPKWKNALRKNIDRRVARALAAHEAEQKKKKAAAGTADTADTAADSASTGTSTTSVPSSICNIERVTELDQATFASTYMEIKPVIISSPAHRANNAAFYQMTELDKLVRTHGDRLMQTTTSEASTTSMGKYITFASYLEQIPEGTTVTLDMEAKDTPYFFGDYREEEWSDLFEQYSQPDLQHSPLETRRLSFGVGPDRSGTPFHFHGPGFSEVLHGEKRWFIFAKDVRDLPIERNNSQSTLQWLEHDYPKLMAGSEDKKPMECVLRQGDVIYFPSFSWHSTLNSGRSVFISTFVKTPSNPPAQAAAPKTEKIVKTEL